jgi:hypothetical protein
MAANISTHALSLLLISTAIFAGLFSNGLFANILSSQANDDAFLEPFTVVQTMKFSNIGVSRRRSYFKRRIAYYSNHVACLSFNKILINIHPNPGPGMDSDKRSIRGLYLNARSLVHKTDKLQSLACDVDIVAVTETWLKPCILDSELLPNLEFFTLFIVGTEPFEPVEGLC